MSDRAKTQERGIPLQLPFDPTAQDAGVEMDRNASAGSGHSQKDVTGAGGFLFKASNSFKRSPSKKHKSQPSDQMHVLDGTLLDLQKQSAPSSRPAATQYRPGFKRAPSAPVTVQTVQTTTVNASIDDQMPHSATEVTMTSASFANGVKREPTSNLSKSMSGPPMGEDINTTTGPSGLPLTPGTVVVIGNQNPKAIYQHIHDMASKRISTLDYMRKAHEGRVFWFNTVHFSRLDISRLPNFSPARLSRRATNYLLLGLSIPAVLDVHPSHNSSAGNASSLHDFLRSLNALLSEFESFQQFHPPDGHSPSSLSRARIPHMFKRATQATTGKTRRTSSAAGTEIGLPMQANVSAPSVQPAINPETHYNHSATPSIDTSFTSNSFSSSTSTLVVPSPAPSISSTTSSFPSTYSSVPAPSDSHPNSILLPNEGPYTHLLTPPLPFAPDFFSVFATLCDVLIDAYQRILQMVNSPSVCTVAVWEVFGKADARLRKLIVGVIIKDFEGAARERGRREVLGVQKVVLGGLMGG